MDTDLLKDKVEEAEVALARARGGDKQGMQILFQTVYDELNRMARGQRRRWSGNDTLDTTALVHETYLKLIEGSCHDWVDLRHFYAVAAKAMRQLLLNYAERQRAQKRGGNRVRIELDEEQVGKAVDVETLLSLSSCLDQLELADPRRASVFEYRFFLGLSVEEVAKLLEISTATVKRDWSLATAWLRIHWQEDGC